MKIQLDIPRELNKKLKIEKVNQDHSSIAQSIIKIIGEYFNAN